MEPGHPAFVSLLAAGLQQQDLPAVDLGQPARQRRSRTSTANCMVGDKEVISLTHTEKTSLCMLFAVTNLNSFYMGPTKKGSSEQYSLSTSRSSSTQLISFNSFYSWNYSFFFRPLPNLELPRLSRMTDVSHN